MITSVTYAQPNPAISPFDRALAAPDFTAGNRTKLPVLAASSAMPMGPLAQQLLTADYREQCRAMLASAAMENTAALSAMEAHLNTVAPSGYRRYKAIVDAYAIGAVYAIARC
jgi:ABC-type phosphate/phosphonate transport system substrate-binding protein